MEFNNIDLSYLEKYLHKNIFLAGTVNGSIGVSDFYKQPAILSDITIHNLKLRNHLFGNVVLSSKWDRENATINTELTINNGDNQYLYANGLKPQAKSTKENFFDNP